MKSCDRIENVNLKNIPSNSKFTVMMREPIPIPVIKDTVSSTEIIINLI